MNVHPMEETTTDLSTTRVLSVASQDLQLMEKGPAQVQAVQEAFAAAGLVLRHLDLNTLRATVEDGAQYAYARDERKFYFLGLA